MQISLSEKNNPKKTMQKKWIYVAGKVTGEDRAKCSLKFSNAVAELNRRGFLVVNPLSIVSDPDCDWKMAMKHCITAMLACDAIYCLPC